MRGLGQLDLTDVLALGILQRRLGTLGMREAAIRRLIIETAQNHRAKDIATSM